MKIIINKYIPFKGYNAINLFGVVFARKELTKAEENHECIHSLQGREMLWIFFYLWYILEWIVRLFMKGRAYRNISFERESYANEADLEYRNKRRWMAWTKYLKS